MKMSRICAIPYLGEELLEKMGILEKTPEKKVETSRKKVEPSGFASRKYGTCRVETPEKTVELQEMLGSVEETL